MTAYLLIALGGALGSVARYALGTAATERWEETFPWGTLVINVLGSFAIGLFASLTDADGRFVLGPNARLFFMTGLCGGFTTFSSFSLQTLVLMREGAWLRAGGNVAGSCFLCLVAVWLGHTLATALGPAGR